MDACNRARSIVLRSKAYMRLHPDTLPPIVKSHDSAGFTLIELLVVISIISLLSSIVIASIDTAREKGRFTAAHQQDAVFQHSIGDRLIGWWPMNDCSGTTVQNVINSTYNGMLEQLFPSGSLPSWTPSDSPSGSGRSLSFLTLSLLKLDDNASIYSVAPAGSVRTYTAWFKAAPNGPNTQIILSKDGGCNGAAIKINTSGFVYGWFGTTPTDCTGEIAQLVAT